MKKLTGFALSASMLLPFAVQAYSAPIAYAAEDTVSSKDKAVGNLSLTYQQALNLALTNNVDLKNSAKDIERSWKMLENASQNSRFVPYEVNDQYASMVYKGALQAQLGYQMSKSQLQISKDKLAYSVEKAYNAVLKSQQQKVVADLALKNADMQANLANLRNTSGMQSKYELNQEFSKLNLARANQKAAEKAIDDAYLRLNNLLGLPKDARPALVEHPDFIKFKDEVPDMEAHILKVTSNSEAVSLLEQQTKLKQAEVDYYSYNGVATEPSEVKEIDVEKAANKATDGKQQLEQGIRSIFLSIKRLEDSYASLQSDLAAAEETLNMAKVRFNVGLGIQADVTSAELLVANKKQATFDILSQLDELKMAYEKPWITN